MMVKKGKWLAVILAVVATLAITIGAATVSAAGPNANNDIQGKCGLQRGFGFGGTVIDEVITQLLGMTEDEIHSLRQQGNSLVQIAVTKNISEQQLIDAIMNYKTAEIQDEVTAGIITQDQANLMLERMEQNTIQSINRTSTGPLAGQNAGHGPRNGTGVCTGQGSMNRWSR